MVKKRNFENSAKGKGKKLSRNALIAEREKRKLFFKYKKMLKKEGKDVTHLRNNDNNKKEIFKKSTDNEESKQNQAKNSKSENTKNVDKKPTTSYKQAQKHYESKIEEKQKQIEESNKRKQEMDKAMNRHKKSRKENFHNLCKKTKRGQIRISGQIDSLLKKIEESKNK